VGATLKIKKIWLCIPCMFEKYTFLKNKDFFPPEADAEEELICIYNTIQYNTIQ
jgi:hypothetical protein